MHRASPLCLTKYPSVHVSVMHFEDADCTFALQTNNPRKIETLESLGVKVTKRIPCIVTAQKHNLGYLSAKKSRMRHLLNEEPVLDGSFCIWNHDGEVLPSSPAMSPPNSRRGPFSDLIDEKELRAERREEVKDLEKSMDEL